MGTTQSGWICHVSTDFTKTGWVDQWEWYPTREEANKAGQGFLEGIDPDHENAREYEVYEHFE